MKAKDTVEEFRSAPRRDPAELEREAEASRESIRRTMDSLEQRLSPGQMLDQAMRMWRDGDSAFAVNLSRTVRSNPVPVLLSSVGLAWLAMADKRAPPPSADSGTSGLRSAGEKMGSAQAHAKDTVGAAQDRARDAASALSERGSRAREGVSRMQGEQPFLVGALGVAVGAALGGAFPRSQTEDAMIGEYGEQARDTAKRAGGAS